MAAKKNNTESVYNLSNYLNENSLLPIYFFFGEDSFTISKAVAKVLEIAEKKITSDFDKQIIETSKESIVSDIVDEASAFPFGGEKKIVLVKNFENISERKTFAEYVNNPAEFTILIISQFGKKLDDSKEPYLSLCKQGYIFEAHELKGVELNQWIRREVKSLDMKISEENAWTLIDLVGENKSLLQMNLLKFADYIPGEEITPESIEKLTSVTKEFNIFHLQDAISSGNKSKSLEIALNLLHNGNDPVYIVTMLSKYLNTVAKSIELSSKKMSEAEAAKAAGVSYFYYKNCTKARFLKSHKRLYQISEALLSAEKSIKTSSSNSKTILTVLISDMFR
ncbi:MAG: DNA polymerase III subunit delta [Melioribacteraceae bacterium]|nr:DNA polymerase III subunit delta [Melioribacteraceae bacterium]